MNTQLMACIIVLMLLCIGCAGMIRLYLCMSELAMPLAYLILCIILIIIL